MAQRPTLRQMADPDRSLLHVVHDGLRAVSTCGSIQTAMLAAIDALTASGDNDIVARGLLHAAVGDEEIGPVGGSTQRRLLLERFLSTTSGAEARPMLVGVQHVERAPVLLDGVELGVLEVYFFDTAAPCEFELVIGTLANAIGLVAFAEREERRVRDQLQLMGNLSHELRTPLTTLIGYTEILTKSWKEIDVVERGRVLGVLDRQARRMVRLSLEAGRIAKNGDVGALELRFDHVDLASAVEVALTDLRHDQDIEVRCGSGLVVRADPDRLQQMLLNLIGNALAHGRPPIEVEAAHGPTRAFVNVVVCDRGTGIDPALLPHVFEPFTRGRTDGADEHTGLGLSIVLQLARRHGGDLFYEPNRPTGARMTLSLPALVA